MIIGAPEGTTRICGKSQGFKGLPIRDEQYDGVNYMITAWTPTPKELEALNKGASVKVTMIGNRPLPMKVEVGEPPEEFDYR